MKKSILVLSLGLLTSMSAFADCSAVNLNGSWSGGIQKQISGENGVFKSEKVWDFMDSGADVIVTTTHSDSMGPTSLDRSRYSGSLETKTCVLELTAVETENETYRDHESDQPYRGVKNARRDFPAGKYKTRYLVIPQADGIILKSLVVKKGERPAVESIKRVQDSYESQ